MTQAKSTKFRANFALPRHALQNVPSGVPSFVPERDSRLPHAQFSVWALKFMLSGSGFRSGLRQVQSDSGQTTAYDKIYCLLRSALTLLHKGHRARALERALLNRTLLLDYM